MNSLLGFIVGLLQTTLSMLGFVQQHPVIPVDHEQQAQQVAQQAITQTQTSLSAGEFSVAPAPKVSPLAVNFSVIDVQANAIDFGDGLFVWLDTLNGWDCMKDAAHCPYVYAPHTYAKPGTYAAKLGDMTLPSGCATQDDDCAKNSKMEVIKTLKVAVADGVQSDVSVPGMTKYTDNDFGFSFWYPSDWVVAPTALDGGDAAWGDAVPKKMLSIGKSKEPQIWITVYTSTNRSITDSGGAGPFGPVRYYFDTNLHEWMKECPEGCPDGSPSGPKAADISQNTMGGLHLFDGTSRFDTNIIPLSAHTFVVTSDGGGANASFLAKTIVASDPSVATPVSALYQKVAIQAEKDVYTPSPPPSSTNASASVSVEKVDGPNVSVNYSNLPTRSYINLLWQDEGGHYEATGSQTVVQQGGNGSTILSMSANGPSGYFIVQVRNMDDINWHADSDQFVYGSPAAAINCTLKATPASVQGGQYVVLSWSSLGAGHATFKQDSAAVALGLPYTDVNADGTQTFRVMAPPETISPTLYISRDTLTGSCSTTITIN